MDRALIDYLPPILKPMREFKAITDGQQEALEALWKAADAVLADQFVDTATLSGIKRWEHILAIKPKGSEALDDRRFRIKTRLNEQLPFTLRALEQQLLTLCGPGGYALWMPAGTYILYVQVALWAKSNFEDVGTLLKRVVPAAIVIDLALKYNTHALLSESTHRNLSSYTHDQLRSEVFHHAG